MKKIWNTIKRNKHTIILSLFLIAIIGVVIINRVQRNYRPSFIKEKKYEEVFDLTKVPAGLIIWIHGVPDKEINFKDADSTSRYEYFDVGILSPSNKVYKVRVPFYAVGLFRLGKTINIIKIPPKKKKKSNGFKKRYDGIKRTKMEETKNILFI